MSRKKKDKLGDNRPINHTNQGLTGWNSVVPIRGRKRSGRLFARWIVGLGTALAITMSVLLVVNTFFAWQNSKQLSYQLSETYSPMFKVKYSELGKQVVLNWFQGKEPPLSFASSINWQAPVAAPTTEPFSYSDDAPTVRDTAFVSGRQFETKLSPKQLAELPASYASSMTEALTYYVVYNNVPYHVSISLLVPRNSEEPPILLTAPTLEVFEPTSQLNVTSDPEGLGLIKVKLPNAAIDQTQSWATAWASNDSKTIKQVTKDSSDAVYRGLGGWTVDSPPKVNWSYEVVASGKRYVAAQIQFTMYQELMPPRTFNEDGTEVTDAKPLKFTVTQTQDILLSDVESGLPAIVAWGPAGTWSALEPLMNALPAGTEVGDKVDGSGFLKDTGRGTINSEDGPDEEVANQADQFGEPDTDNSVSPPTGSNSNNGTGIKPSPSPTTKAEDQQH